MSFLKALSGDKKGNYLDIGCATGGQVFFAEELGYSSYGLDNDPDLLRIAEEKKIKKGSGAEFIFGDMRKVSDLFPEIRFNVITCMGNTLVHLGSYSELCRLFDSVYSQLEKGGIFAAQIVNYDNPRTKGVMAFKDIEGDDFVFVRGIRVVENGEEIEFSGELILKETGEKFMNTVLLYPVNSRAVRRGLEGSGFNLIRFYGNFDREAYGETSNALIFIAEK